MRRMSIATYNASDRLTTPAMASAAGVPEWMLRAAVRRRFIDPPAKVGPTWAWRPEDLARVRDGLRRAGYLPAEPEATTEKHDG